MWSYVWLLLVLFVVCKDIIVVMARSTESPAAILFPSQTGVDDSRSSICSAPDPSLNYKPVIGILSHPGDGATGRLNNDTNASYIAASYVKLAEAGGARVIPLIYNEPEELLFQKLELVNGVIFTGGWAKEGLYFDIVQKIFTKALERNDGGEHFPVYAICLGFELLTMIISQNRDIFEKVDAKNSASSLQFVENVSTQGTVFQRFPSELLKKVTTDCLVMQNHQFGISPDNFEGNIALSRFFKIVTTCLDGNRKAYVSTVQSKTYPVTGFQWHPEKNAFEWGSSEIPHSEDAVHVTQLTANYLVSEARKSLNRPSPEKVLSNLIYNYKPTYCGYEGRVIRCRGFTSGEGGRTLQEKGRETRNRVERASRGFRRFGINRVGESLEGSEGLEIKKRAKTRVEGESLPLRICFFHFRINMESVVVCCFMLSIVWSVVMRPL